MPTWLLAPLRTAAQFVVTSVVAWLATRGIPVPEAFQGYIADTILFAGALAAITAGLRWLETRQGYGFWPSAARWLAKVLMLGLSGKQPVYVEPGQRLAVVNADGETHSPR